MTTVPERWTAESWEESMRGHVAIGGNLYPYTVGVIESITSDLHLSDADKVARIREVLVARGRAAAVDSTGLDYSREVDDPTPVSGARVEPHVGAVTDEGLVDESELPECSDECAEFDGPHLDDCPRRIALDKRFR